MSLWIYNQLQAFKNRRGRRKAKISVGNKPQWLHCDSKIVLGKLYRRTRHNDWITMELSGTCRRLIGGAGVPACAMGYRAAQIATWVAMAFERPRGPSGAETTGGCPNSRL